MRHEIEVVSSLARVFGHLIAESDLDVALDQLMEETRRLFASRAASVVLRKHGGAGLRVAAWSSNTKTPTDFHSLDFPDGPVLECIITGHAVTESDIHAMFQRWPLFSAWALQHGFQSIHVIPLRTPAGTIGALNLFDSTGEQFNQQQLRAGQAFADVATISILHHRRMKKMTTVAEQLQGALNSRVIIEQAKGVISHAHNVDMDDAFTSLRRYARVQGRSLRDVATEIANGHLSADVLTLHFDRPNRGQAHP